MWSMSRYRTSHGIFAGAELPRDRQHLLRAHVRPPRLLVAERPQRRHRSAAGQRRVALEHVGGRRAQQHVDDEVVGRLDRHAVRVGLAQIELDPPRMVVEHAVRPSLVQAQHERDRGVEVVERRGVPGRRVDVPEHLPRGGLLESRRPLAAAEVPLALRLQLDQALERGDQSRAVVERDPVAIDHRPAGRGLEPRERGRRVDDRRRRVDRGSQAEDTVGDRGDLHERPTH